MLPVALIGLAIGAGFLMTRSSSRGKVDDERNVRGLTYSPDVVKRGIISQTAQLYGPKIAVLPEYALVRELVRKKFPITLVTGGAGTGKSTMIRWLMNEFEGSVLVAAPTGIAALNVDGKTLHSLCNLPPAWIVAKDIKLKPRRREISEAKLLIIDEISMVTANLLDGVSEFFRKNRRVDKPFGGLPVVLVGDMFQLPPVVELVQRPIYNLVYGTASFFNAKCLEEAPYYGVELTKSYRQTESDFIQVLANVREGFNSEGSIDYFNSKCTVTSLPPEGALWLSPRNAEVDRINSKKLVEIPGDSRLYVGTLEGNFKADRLPSPKHLELKVGAQVLFSKNDPGKRWVNGTVGKVRELADDSVTVEIGGPENVVQVSRVRWSDYRYQWNATTHEIDRTEIGNYTQFPLMLAWAMTIHKSQGRTLDRVHLDLGQGAFETGQTYVALSRCRTIGGITLARKLQLADLLVDVNTAKFYTKLRESIKKLPPEKMMKKMTAT